MWLIDRVRPLKYLAIWLWNLPLTEPLHGRISWFFNAKFVIGASCVVFDNQGRVLLVRHTYKRRPWGLPGGGVGGAESPEEGALRELSEEACVDGVILRLIGVRVHRRMHLLDIFYLCSSTEREFKPSAEIAERRWFALDALPPNTSTAQRAVVLLARRQLDGEAPAPLLSSHTLDNLK